MLGFHITPPTLLIAIGIGVRTSDRFSPAGHPIFNINAHALVIHLIYVLILKCLMRFFQAIGLSSTCVSF